MKIHKLTIEEIQKGYNKKRFSVEEVVQAYIGRIKKYDDKTGAFITLCEDEALKQARKLDQRLSNGEAIGLLGGIPVAIKDNICTKGVRTTCASKMLEDFTASYDATIVKKLKEAGAIIIGKTNLDEFSIGTSTESSAFQITKNPWDLRKVPGGSSGGSAAALAAGFAPLTIGSDTGGSIRQPASFCGVVGLKPTYGLVSRYGLIAFASSLDHIGPFTKTVRDSALALQVIQGKDPMDATSIRKNLNIDYTQYLDKGVRGLKIGVPKEFLGKELDIEIVEPLQKIVQYLKEQGAVVKEISLPIIESALFSYQTISSAEASSNLARYDGIRYGYKTENYESLEDLMINSRTEGFGKAVKRKIMLGTYFLSSENYDVYYKRSMLFRAKIRKAFQKAFESYDVLLTPTSPILPFDIGEKIEDPLAMCLADIYTTSANLAGLPAISIPGGLSQDRLPIGIQLIGNHYAEGILFQIANSIEKGVDFQRNAPLKEMS